MAAQEPDRSQEGTAAPEGPGDAEVDAPTFDPGGTGTTLPFDPSAPPDGADADDGVGTPLDAEPLQDPDLPEPEPDAPPPPDEGNLVAPEPEAEAPPETSEPPSTPPTQPQSSPTDLPQTQPSEPQRLPAETPADQQKVDRSGRPHANPQPRPQPQPQPQLGRSVNPPPQSTTVQIGGARSPAQPAPSEQSTRVVHAPARSADNEDRIHVVRPGDSLWAIAERLLGPGASPARVSREVQRLWSLNHERIGTGDPDLLMVGTELRLA